MTTLEAIRAKCIEVNPELMSPGDIKPGTHLKHKTEGWETVATSSVDRFGGVSHENGCGPALSFVKAARPIRLADVLLVMNIEFVRTDSPAHMNFWLNDGHFCAGINRAGIRWNLREDNLEKQSPETVEFIGKVLGL